MEEYKQTIKGIIKDTFKFSGRTSLKDYWYYNLFLLIIAAPFILTMVILDVFDLFSKDLDFLLYILLPPIIISLIPKPALMVRRYHDVGVSGTVILWVFFSRLIWFLLGGAKLYDYGDPGDNKYGPNPTKVLNNIKDPIEKKQYQEKWDEWNKKRNNTNNQ